MKRIFLVFLSLFYLFPLFCQNNVSINDKTIVKQTYILTDNETLRQDFEYYNKIFVEEGIFKQPISVKYIGYYTPDYHLIYDGICYCTEIGNIIVLFINDSWDSSRYRRVLIHEMIHAYQYQVLNETDVPHNESFKNIAREINLKFHWNIQSY